MASTCSKPCHGGAAEPDSASKLLPAEPLSGGGQPSAASLFRRTPLREERKPSWYRDANRQPYRRPSQWLWLAYWVVARALHVMKHDPGLDLFCVTTRRRTRAGAGHWAGKEGLRTRDAASLCSSSVAARLTGSGMPEVGSCASASHFWAAVDCAARALPMPSRKACMPAGHVEQLTGSSSLMMPNGPSRP